MKRNLTSFSMVELSKETTKRVKSKELLMLLRLNIIRSKIKICRVLEIIIVVRIDLASLLRSKERDQERLTEANISKEIRK